MKYVIQSVIFLLSCLVSISLVCSAEPVPTPTVPPPTPVPPTEYGLLPFRLDLDPGFKEGAEALELWSAGKKEEAATLLAGVSSQGVPEQRRRILLATLFLELDEPDKAASLLATVESPPLIVDHVLTLHGRALLDGEKPDEAVRILEKVPSSSPLVEQVHLLIARSEIDRGQPGKALAALEPLTRDRTFETTEPKTLALEAEALALLGDPKKSQEAINHYQAILVWHPLSVEAKAAREALAKLEKQGLKLPAASVEEQVTTAKIYLEANFNNTVVKALEPLAADKKLKPDIRCEVAYSLGKAYQNLRQYTNAVAPLTDASRLCDADRQVRSLYRLERGHLRKGNPAQAEAVMRDIVTRFPDHSYSDDAMFMLASEYQTENKQKEAVALLNEQIQRFPKGDMRGEASWRLAWAAYRQNQLGEAIKLLEARLKDEAMAATAAAEAAKAEKVDDAKKTAAEAGTATSEKTATEGGAAPAEGVAAPSEKKEAAESASQSTPKATPMPPSIPDPDRERYWIARWRELEGKTPAVETEKAYMALASDAPESYYGLLAYLRLQTLKKDAATALSSRSIALMAQKVAIRPIDVSALPQPLQHAIELLRCGLKKQATRELTPLIDESVATRNLLVSALFEAAGQPSLSHGIPREVLKRSGDIHLDLESRALYLLGYPKAFYDQIQDAAQERGLDPFLLTAIAREESAFNPDIRSWAGAIGLVQLMPGTARIVARQLKLAPPDPQTLFDRTLNLKLGAKFLSSLMDRYKGHSGLAIPAYNAGEGAVDRWVREQKTLPYDEFVEEIPYQQTREYAKRVLEAYQTYHQLYSDTPYLQFPMDLPY